MSNELVFLLISLLGAAGIMLSLRLGHEAIVVALSMNLALVAATGSELIALAGGITNAGNVFYALAIFALNILNEYFGEKTALQAVWAGVIGVALFAVMMALVSQFAGAPVTATTNEALNILFTRLPRISLASLIAFLVAARINVWLYSLIRQKITGVVSVGVSNIGSAVVTQAVDSVLFFFLAFGGLMPTEAVVGIMVIGFISKVAVAVIATPALYWGRLFAPKPVQE